MTILNQYPMPYTNVIAIIMGTIFIVIGCMMLFMAGVMSEDDIKSSVGCIFGFVLAVGLGILFILGSKQENKDVTYYDVILEDDYPLKELLNSYELVEQRGEIYVIKNKEKDDGK